MGGTTPDPRERGARVDAQARSRNGRIRRAWIGVVRPAAMATAVFSMAAACGGAERAALAAGGGGSPPPVGAGDVLVLRLGGREAAPLRVMLARHGIELPQEERLDPETPPILVPDSVGDQEERPPTPVPSDEPRTVPLPPGGTLSTLCQRELGSSRHWPAVAKFNGWERGDLNRLRAGTPVRLPPELDPQRN